MATNRKAVVLLSGGMDSTTCLYLALRDHDSLDVRAVFMSYDQRHLESESAAAHKIAGSVGVSFHTFNLGDNMGVGGLIDHSLPIPDKTYSEIEGTSPLYVPFRNGVLLSLAASYAMTLGGPGLDLYFGAHMEDARNYAYPDCTTEFASAMTAAIYHGTGGAVSLKTPLLGLDKSGVVVLGSDLGVPWEKTWSCYRGLERQCGKCPTCYSRKAAFAAANVVDPTEYTP